MQRSWPDYLGPALLISGALSLTKGVGKFSGPFFAEFFAIIDIPPPVHL
jgi:hypothetical protein